MAERAATWTILMTVETEWLRERLAQYERWIGSRLECEGDREYADLVRAELIRRATPETA